MKRRRSTASELLNTRYKAVQRAWASETDRGLALVMAAYFDDLLDDLLRRSFADDAAAVEKLLGVDRPLSLFSAKIEMAYVLGLVTKPLYKTLHQIREIRNHFAHAGRAHDFNDTGIKDRCDALHALPEPIADGVPSDLHPRMKFIGGASLAMRELQLSIGGARHAPVREVPPVAKQ